MPKWKNTKKIESEGVIFFKGIVNENGSIYREIPGDKDTGIDGFIEFVDDEEVSGEMLAVQIKSGVSYYKEETEEFELYVNEQQLEYWCNFMLPVILVFYNPDLKIGAFVSIREYVEHEQYHSRGIIKKIVVSAARRILSSETFSKIRGYAKIYSDSMNLVKFYDKCLSDNLEESYDAFTILINHPHSSNRLTLYVARRMLHYSNEDVIKDVIWVLGYGVGRKRWSFNPGNLEEKSIANFSATICSELTEQELYRMLCAIDDEYFHGPDALGERFFDIISCCWDEAAKLLDRVCNDKKESFQRRKNALYLLYECEDEFLKETYENEGFPQNLKDLFDWIFVNNDVKQK